MAVVTCRPAFELVERPEVFVRDKEEGRVEAFWEWLVLDDGRQRYRILWASPPLSRGPVELHGYQTYTFSVVTMSGYYGPFSKVTRIVEGGKVIYEAPQEAAWPSARP